ncbi:phosphotransferase [Mycobacterium branderi]|nr:phosphotransferase [Mycobacterium branderi]MCV7235192.1 phosphotransferase [Mycobacterium branderi]
MDEKAVLPGKLEEIDASFLTAALSARYPGTRVGGVTLADLRQGSASSLRLRLDFADNPHGLPQLMYMKGDFIDHDFTSAAAFAAEAHYFHHLADKLSDAVRQPRAYFAGVDEQGQAIVLLEDLGLRGVRFGDCEQPLDVDTVADGVRQLAAIQGRFWRGHGLERFDWISDVTSVAALMQFLVQPDHFDDYINRERARFLSGPLRDRQRIEAALQAMFESDRALPTAFVHGDAHLGNTFRDPAGKLGFCDFQAMGRGPYIWDVTYFMTGAMNPKERSRFERDLLSLYLDELRRNGADEIPTLQDAFLAHRAT